MDDDDDDGRKIYMNIDSRVEGTRCVAGAIHCHNEEILMIPSDPVAQAENALFSRI